MNPDAAHHATRNGGEALVASFVQRRLWFLDQLTRGSSDYLLPLALRLRGDLDVAALERALAGIVDRHEVLRTRFVAVDGEPVPQVDRPGGVALERIDVGSLAEVFERGLARPIDLATEPPLRMTLARLAHDDHVLLVVVHHIAVDGWSWRVLLGELAAGYRGEQVAPPALGYADVARAQNERLNGARMTRLVDYWRTRLAGLVPLALPTDRPRPRFWDGSGDVIGFALPADLVAEVDRVARRYRVTRYMLLLAVYQALLARHTGQTDIAVCTTMADRGNPEVANLIGPFVNTVVLRTDLSGEPTFHALLDRVRAGALGDLSHADAPFDRVVGAVTVDRDLSRHPLAQASFTLLNAAIPPLTLPGLAVELVPPPVSGTPMDVFLDLQLRHDGSIVARLEYATALFDEGTMHQFGAGYVELLRAVLATPEAPVTELARRLAPLPGRSPGRLVDGCGPAHVRPATDGSANPAPVGAVAPRLAVSGAPGDVALVCTEKVVRYGELDGLTGGLATLLADRGVAPGSVVGVCLARGVWSVAAMLAVWRAGGVYLPLDPALPVERMRFMATHAGIDCVVGDTTTADPLTALGVPVVTVENVHPTNHGPHPTPDPHDLAYIIFTSGSTGKPKAVGVEHGALAAHVTAARDHFAITPSDRVLAFASFSFDASLDQLLPALTCGATVVIRPDEPWLPAQIPTVVARHGITVANFPPTFWAELAFSLTDRAASALSSLRLLILGGETIPTGALAAWQAAVPRVRVCNAYGPTEATVTATAYEVVGPVEGRVPIGRPLGSRRVYVVDTHDQPVPVGVPGELLIGGPELARGYLGQPALTAERFIPDPFGNTGGRLYRTGDIARWAPTGNLEFLGRTDNQTKIRGLRIEPGEIEAILGEHAGVRGAAVLVRQIRTERALVAYVAGTGLSADQLAAWCRTGLPDYMVPAAFVLLDALPLTVQGKLDVAALPDPQPPAPVTFVPPRTPTEVVTAQIWAEVLDLPQVGVHDNFFALGGHSLRAVAAASRLRAAFDYPIAVRDLFEHPTVELLAVQVERQLVEQISAMSDEEIELSLTVDQRN